MNNITRVFCQVVVAAFAVVAICASAADDAWFDDNWRFNGFGTIGYTNAGKYDHRTARRNINQKGEKLRQNGFLMDSRLGFQLKGQLNDHWDVVAQIVARQQLANHVEDHIDIAFIRYRASNEWQITLGRQAFNLFLLSDHRNTAYSYDWIRPPTEFYGFIPNDSVDGIKVSRDWGDFDDAWHWNFSVGSVKSKLGSDVLAQSDDVSSTKASPVYATELDWQSGHWQFRVSVALMKLRDDANSNAFFEQLAQEVIPVWPGFAAIVADFNAPSTLRYGSLGAVWQADGWKAQAEWNIIDSDFIGISGQRAYAHLARRFRQWQPFVTLGYASDNGTVDYAAPPVGSGLMPLLDDMLMTAKGLRHNQRSISLGVRWDFMAQKALKLQCDRFYFEAGSGSIHGRVDLRYPDDEIRSWCSVAFDWVF